MLDSSRRRAAVGDRPARRFRRRRAGRRDRGHRRPGRALRQHRLAAAAELSGLRPQRACAILAATASSRQRGQRRSRASRSRCAAPDRPTRSTVRTPGGRSVAMSREQGETFTLQRHRRAGRLRGRRGEARVRGTSPSICSTAPKATSSPATEPSRSATARSKGQAGWEGARRELWKLLLLGALGVLCLEWYIYNRRRVPMNAASCGLRRPRHAASLPADSPQEPTMIRKALLPRPKKKKPRPAPPQEDHPQAARKRPDQAGQLRGVSREGPRRLRRAARGPAGHGQPALAAHPPGRPAAARAEVRPARRQGTFSTSAAAPGRSPSTC